MKIGQQSIFWGAMLMAIIAPMASAEEAFFPLMAWNWPPTDEKTLNEMRACGLTMAGFVPPSGLDACHAAGLKAIVNDPRCSGYDWMNVDAEQARANAASLVGEVKNHPALFGYYLCDEPVAAQLPGLGIVAAAFQELDPERWTYINLFPNVVSMERLGVKDYDEYIERYVAACRPKILSYDHYALFETMELRPTYFTNLEQMRAASLRHGIPFWNIVLTVAHFTYRELTHADMRFQAFSTLAYGGRGISYFTYIAPNVGNYRMAPIDQFGNRTPVWYYMQNVNLQVLKLAPTLLKLRSDEVYHLGDVPDGCKGPGETSLVPSISEGRYVVGDFTHEDGSRYALVVNKDLTYSHPCRPVFAPRVKRALMVSPFTGDIGPFEGENQYLAAGQGVLLKLETDE